MFLWKNWICVALPTKIPGGSCSNTKPVIIEEIQRVPGLFPYIQAMVDLDPSPGHIAGDLAG
ncbi:MAG: hypothetical protein A3J97_10475 [Spirochaetes bacterium RIFOXYC1_FULL_54_7]|nr:MAG: hypothetical protein A3J97_10475 [Spirochaetes bacterium RIFOXYC1_FULL_54_7]